MKFCLKKKTFFFACISPLLGLLFTRSFSSPPNHEIINLTKISGGYPQDNNSMTRAFFNNSNLASSIARLSIAATSPPPPARSDPAVLGDLQQRLQTLVEGSDRLSSWTYAIFWESSIDIQTGDSLLSWGNGYYKGSDNASTTASASEQEHRKRFLCELNSLITGATISDGDDAIEDEDVTDTEWLFLVSMTQNFVNGSRLPGQAMFTGNPIWIAGAHQLAASSCDRAQKANLLGIQTMVCVPVDNGVLELGSTNVIIFDSQIIERGRVLCNFGSGSEVPPDTCA